MIILRGAKRQSFTRSLKNSLSEKSQGGVKLTPQPFKDLSFVNLYVVQTSEQVK